MKHIKLKITWSLFIFLAFIVIVLNQPIRLRYIKNTLRQFKKLALQRSIFIEDKDWN